MVGAELCRKEALQEQDWHHYLSDKCDEIDISIYLLLEKVSHF